LFRGRTAPFEFAIKQHILQLISEEPDMDDIEVKEEKDENDQSDNEDSGDKKERKDVEKDEVEEDWDKLFNIKD
jgi:replicative superfamily II helicase